MTGVAVVTVVAAVSVAVAVALSPMLAEAQRQVIGEVKVKIRNCTIVGSELNVTISGEERPLFRFLRVPYAEAPVGLRRFAAPEPFTEFDQPDCKLNATGDEPGGSLIEDLLLRVSIRTPDLSGQRPVLALLLGGSTDFDDEIVGHEDGDALAAGIDGAASGVILATVGSRTGVLGNLPAGLNAGLLDQRLALRFLREAIGVFGGDPSRVSLAGHGPSAAGAVGLHSIGVVGDSPGFSRVIMMSGSIKAPMAWSASSEVAAELDLRFAESLGCVAEGSRLSLECLRQQSLQSLLDAEAALLRDDVNGTGRFEPSFNASEKLPDARWRGGGFNGSLLIGASSGAGLALAKRALRLLGRVDWGSVNKTDFEAMLDRELGQFPRLHAEGGGTSISGRRFLRVALSDWPHAAFGASVQSTLARALSDFGVACPAWLATSELLSSGGAEVFMYLLDLDIDPTEPEKAATDVAYLLGEPLLRPNYPAEHRSLARLMSRHLAAFVTAGVPGSDWSASSVSSSEFMRFSAESNANNSAKLSTGGFAFEPGRCPLWTAEMPLANALSGPATPRPALETKTSRTMPQQQQQQQHWSLPKPVSNTVLRNFSINVIGYGDTIGQTIRTPAGKVMSQFLGLPYAKPPIGDRRFKPPEKLDVLPSPQTYVAISPKPACVQFGHPSSGQVLDTSEDCLYMNLWTPATSEVTVTNLPVLLFLHGGFFEAGDAADDRWRGSHVLDFGDAVVVTAAYRLGPLGFLWIPGVVSANLGLRDQAMVIEWVSGRNIRRFGGSSSKVTLIGVESGAASVGFHLLAGKSQFQRAVLLSGSPNMPYLVSPRTDSVQQLHSNFTAASLQCNTFGSTKSLLACLQALNVSDIVSAAAEFQLNEARLPAPFIAFGPVLDNDFLNSEPWATDSLPPLPPLLLGGVAAPGNALLRMLLSSQQLQNMTRDELQTLLADSLRHFPRFAESLSPVGLQAAANRFARFPDPGAGSPGVGSDARLLAQALGDRHFSCPSWKFMAAASARQQPEPVFGFLLAAPAEAPPSGDPLIGATLFDDAHILMGRPAGPAKPLGEVPAQLSAFLVRSLLDFAENGSPRWEAYDAASQRVLLLRDPGDGDNATSPLRYVEDVYRGQNCAFWDQALPCIDSPHCISQLDPPMTTTMTTPTETTPTTSPTTRTSTDSQADSTPTQVTGESTSTIRPPVTDSTGSTLSTGPTNPSPDVDTTSAPIVPSTTPPTSTVDPGTGGGGLDMLAIVLIVVFSIVGVALLIGGGFLIYRFYSRSPSRGDTDLPERYPSRTQNQQQQQQQNNKPLDRAVDQEPPQAASNRQRIGADSADQRPANKTTVQPGKQESTAVGAAIYGSLADQQQQQHTASVDGVNNEGFSSVEESKM